jgi:uncharacterized SAM-binding protein YcdF (DUF218 family)
MLIFLSKFLPIFVYPAGLLFLFLICAFLLYKRRRIQKIFLLFALFTLLLGGNRWFALSLVHLLEQQYPSLEGSPKADAIVVLGGGTEMISAPRQIPEINGAGDRVLYAVQLYRQGAAPIILASGGRINWYDSAASTPAEEMRLLLEFMGVPSEAILLEDQSQNTYENAQFSAIKLAQLDARRILLVTSAMHMPRAAALFQAQGVEIIPAPTDYIVSEVEWRTLWHSGWASFLLNLFPSASSLNQTTNALKEYIGLTVYWMQGRLQ